MITAVDTNVLLDVFGADPKFGPSSRDALTRCVEQGAILASDVVWAEVTAAFPDGDAAESALDGLGAAYSPSGRPSAIRAGLAWRAYRAAGGPRTRGAADFLVGTHAQEQADRLLTRDRGFFRTYFVDLQVLDPSTDQSR